MNESSGNVYVFELFKSFYELRNTHAFYEHTHGISCCDYLVKLQKRANFERIQKGSSPMLRLQRMSQRRSYSSSNISLFTKILVIMCLAQPNGMSFARKRGWLWTLTLTIFNPPCTVVDCTVSFSIGSRRISVNNSKRVKKKKKEETEDMFTSFVLMS